MALAGDILRIQAPKLKRDWKGHRVLIEHKVGTRLATIPEGARGVVAYMAPGKCEVKIDPCPHCGVSAVIVFDPTNYGRSFTFYQLPSE